MLVGAKAHCTFCGLNGGGMAYRAMKCHNALEMINGLIERYRHRVKHFSCVDNIIPREYILDVFPKVVRHPGITIFYEVRADLTDEEMEILSDAGVLEMQPGIEALATSTLKLMRKGSSAFNNIRFLQQCLRYSVRPGWNLLIGFPGEEEAVYEKYVADLSLLHHLPPPNGVFPVRFDRYSPYFTQFEKYNLDLHPLDYYFFIYPLNEESLNKIAYYFSDHNYEAEYIANTGKWIDRLQESVENWRVQWTKVNTGIFPKLFFSNEGDNDMVIDTRTSIERRQVLENGEKDILINFNQRKNISGIKDQMPEMSEEKLTRSIRRLRDMGLLFEENGTYMNLVFESEPSLKETKLFH
ncbi:MAG TPA: RiPP maturation radical SAM C-methyltransferase [Puia sp.]|uniref:RiPP maturation radical SAM C-methyltransferase n=1 Tax=Puia sp. TaxID=2045100 RepID=UPI002B7A2460|nr:RiPP maturation radical SAM C-methyltransferase [Puia sp.]HVU94488.1 RiPP maturation radical SAM C-methyltransferase [Puia sp.]